jgi:hypothetical protein
MQWFLASPPNPPSLFKIPATEEGVLHLDMVRFLGMGKAYSRFRRLRQCCSVSIILLLAMAAMAEAQARVVAIGDVHGAYPEFSAILQRTGLTDKNRRWAGGSAILIQIGDILDRGPQARECLDLLMQLEREAEKTRGRVIPLLGNHEVMNMMGDLRYVSADGYRSFATAQSGRLRDRAYQDYLKFLATHAGHTHTSMSPDESARRKWMDEHPPGYFEYRDAMGPNGVYGRWLRKHHAIVRVGDCLFVHGGLNPKLPPHSIAELDKQIRSELADFDSCWQSLSEKKVIWRYMDLPEAVQRVVEELKRIKEQGRIDDPETFMQMRKLSGYQSWMSVSQEGPLWYRGLAEEAEETLIVDVKAMLARLGVHYLVAGHTPLSRFSIMPRFDNHVFLIDTGMLKESFGGRASALEIQNGKLVAYYNDEEPQELIPPAGALKKKSGLR